MMNFTGSFPCFCRNYYFSDSGRPLPPSWRSKRSRLLYFFFILILVSADSGFLCYRFAARSGCGIDRFLPPCPRPWLRLSRSPKLLPPRLSSALLTAIVAIASCGFPVRCGYRDRQTSAAAVVSAALLAAAVIAVAKALSARGYPCVFFCRRCVLTVVSAALFPPCGYWRSPNASAWLFLLPSPRPLGCLCCDPCVSAVPVLTPGSTFCPASAVLFPPPPSPVQLPFVSGRCTFVSAACTVLFSGRQLSLLPAQPLFSGRCTFVSSACTSLFSGVVLSFRCLRSLSWTPAQLLSLLPE